jgi:predicted dithiol-disulfide oxidoreductase (DUF899 family)
VSRVETREEWLAARVALPAEEKELTRRSDELARNRGWPHAGCPGSGTGVLSATSQPLDRRPKGRGGDPEGWPRRHDEYE